jgi:protein-S-isoprenylcysteine O-methyltransferase Ste14
MDLKRLVGSGDKIGLFTLPFVVVGVILNLAYPTAFQVGGPPTWLWWLSIGMLVPGLATWLWSVILILANVPRGRLITGGPYGWVKHPLRGSRAARAAVGRVPARHLAGCRDRGGPVPRLPDLRAG